MLIIGICLLMEMKALNLNQTIKMSTFLGSISNGFIATESREVSLNEKQYDFFSCF